MKSYWDKGLRPGVFGFLRWLALACVLVGAISPALATKTYSDNGDGTVTDPTTGLTWMRCAMGQTWDGSTCTGTVNGYYFTEASALTGAVTFAGQTDWRLPNIRELSTIADRSGWYPAIDISVFPNAPAWYFWSATAGPVYLNYTRYVDFVNGSVNSGSGVSTAMNVRLVRGGKSFEYLLNPARPTSDYIDQGNGTVTHAPTGLTWQRCSIGQTWSGNSCSGTASGFALDAAKLLTSSLGGQTDWRLPTIDELETLVDYKNASPSANTTLFPSTSGTFWSASIEATYPSYSWVVDLDFGFSYPTSKSYYNRVRLVRAGQSAGTSVSLGITLSGTGSGIVSSSPSGINCGGTCSANFSTGTSVTLTATSATGSAFTGWSGACTGTGSCVLSMNEARSVTATFGSAITNSLNLDSGWNLIGNGVQVPIAVATSFNDSTTIASIWKWVAAGSTPGISYPTWAFYSPAQADGGAAYAAGKGYELLTSINGGEGFWVNAKTDFTAQLPTGTPVSSTSLQGMSSGWHLISIGDTKTASTFNTDLSTSPPAAGVVPQNLTTLWAWDNAQSKWYFYAPSLEAQGGTALTDYITSHGYLDFTSANKTLGLGVGFWVNKP